MRLSCLQDNLNRGLTVIGRAVATRTTLPITHNVLMSTDNGRLKLSATNLELAISTWVGGVIEVEGSLTVPARLLTEFVSSLGSESIDLDSENNAKVLEIKCGRFEATISGTDSEEFPPIPSVDQGIRVQVDSQTLKTGINQTVVAAATEESRPVLTGIKLEVNEDQFTLAAADGFRLAVYKGNVERAVDEPISVIIPARTLTEISRFIGDQQELIDVVVSPSGAQALFRLTNVEVVTQLIHGNFPTFAEILEDAMKDTKTTVDVELDKFLSATRSASIFARDSSGIVRMKLSPGEGDNSGQITISSRAEELGENIGEIDGLVTGEESQIAFNSKYLLDVLSAIKTDNVSLTTSGPSRAGVFKATDSDHYMHLVMPMFVQW